MVDRHGQDGAARLDVLMGQQDEAGRRLGVVDVHINLQQQQQQQQYTNKVLKPNISTTNFQYWCAAVWCAVACSAVQCCAFKVSHSCLNATGALHMTRSLPPFIHAVMCQCVPSKPGLSLYVVVSAEGHFLATAASTSCSSAVRVGWGKWPGWHA